jgi:hypothetical protein
MSRNQTTKTTINSSQKQLEENNQPDDEVEDLEEIEEIEDVEGDDGEEIEEQTKKSKKIDLFFNSYDDAFQKLLELDSEIEQAIKTRKLVFRIYQKLMQKQLKKTTKKRKNNTDTPKEATGFIKAKPVPEKFKTFYHDHLKSDQLFLNKFPNFDLDSNNPRTEITKIIYDYIRNNELYKKSEDGTINKREIKPNEALRTLFSIKSDNTIVFNNFQTYVSRLYSVVETPEVLGDVSIEESEDEQTKKLNTSKKGFKPATRS